MTTRFRVILFVIVAVLAIVGATAYVLRVRSGQQAASATAPGRSTDALQSVGSVPHVVFRNTALGAQYGRVAMVPLSAPDGGRAFTDLSCERVFATGSSTLCLASEFGVRITAKVYPSTGPAATQLPLAGIPSRARLSDDGALAATTSFVSGDSYAGANFSTRTVVTRLEDHSSADLETFALLHEGRRIAPIERNFWGVTFAADDDTFYATVAFGGQTWLTRGSLSKRSIETLRADAECPSLSPDGTKVAYKKRGDRAAGDWRLAVLDLATGREVSLNEQRSVDDQVVWLDDEHILYGMPGNGAESDVWVVPADGTGTPSVYIADAWSPAVVR
jgi:hypothetical protein